MAYHGYYLLIVGGPTAGTDSLTEGTTALLVGAVPPIIIIAYPRDRQ